MLNEALAWYLAPWRKIGRAPFNTVLFVAFLVPFLIAGAGFAGLTSEGALSLGSLLSMPTIQPQWAWAKGVEVALWVLLFPLVRMRLRDVGVASSNLMLWLAAIYASVVLDAVNRCVGKDLFGPVLTLAGALNFILIAWLSLAPGKVTEAATPAKGRLDDTDPYPPFRP